MGRGVAEGLAAIVENVPTLRGAVMAHCQSNLFPPLNRTEAGACCMAVEGLAGLLAADPLGQGLAHLDTPQNRQLFLQVVNMFHLWPFVAAGQRLVYSDDTADRLEDAEELADYWPADDDDDG